MCGSPKKKTRVQDDQRTPPCGGKKRPFPTLGRGNQKRTLERGEAQILGAGGYSVGRGPATEGSDIKNPGKGGTHNKTPKKGGMCQKKKKCGSDKIKPRTTTLYN